MTKSSLCEKLRAGTWIVPIEETIMDEAICVMGFFHLHVLPRTSWTWNEFETNTPPNSIALDGMVLGGPRFDEIAHRVNFDHHDGVVREATMSTAMQVMFAIKGGIMKLLHPIIHVYVNDTDQDTSLAVWLLVQHAQFDGTKEHPAINRLLALTDRLDITGGAYPMNLRDELLQRHTWVFEPYTRLRKSGALAHATAVVMSNNLETVMQRLNRFMMGETETVTLDTRHTILYENAHFKIVDEIGGNEARYDLFSKGMDAFVSIVARRPDGRTVYTIGRRSRYIPFPVPRLYQAMNAAEGFTTTEGWNGSDIIGGSPRASGSGLIWEQIRDIILRELRYPV